MASITAQKSEAIRNIIAIKSLRASGLSRSELERAYIDAVRLLLADMTLSQLKAAEGRSRALVDVLSESWAPDYDTRHDLIGKSFRDGPVRLVVQSLHDNGVDVWCLSDTGLWAYSAKSVEDLMNRKRSAAISE